MRSVILTVALSLAFCGCHSVKSYQRGNLMTTVMVDPPGDLESAHDAHVHGTRESMTGASTGGGASCGCM